MTDLIHLYVHVTGVVQGVCYRAFVWENARLFGVKGWVRNLPDGSVEAELEGERSLVNQLMEEMRIGPRMAHVSALTVEERSDLSGHDSFQVR